MSTNREKRCRLFHRWGEWKHLTITRSDNGGKYDVDERECLRCGRRERHSL